MIPPLGGSILFVNPGSILIINQYLLWGITQALIIFYMEHKKDKVLGITLDRIIQVSLGQLLVTITLFLFLSEMMCWIVAVCLENHYLMMVDLILQLINIVAVFVIIHFKQIPTSVIGTCNWEVCHVRKKYMETEDGINIPQLLLFDMLREENLSTSMSIEEMKNSIKNAYSSDDKEDEKRFRYELYLTERICECCRADNISEGQNGESYGIPKAIKCFFEDANAGHSFSEKVILYHLVRSRNVYDVKDVICMLRLVSPLPLDLYAWCGIWSIYWRKRGSDFIRESDILQYKAVAEDVSVPLIDLMRVSAETEDYIMSLAYKEWEELPVG